MKLKQKKEKSEINLLAGKASFTDEPLWFRLIMITIMVAFLLVITWLFNGWVIPSVAVLKLSNFNTA